MDWQLIQGRTGQLSLFGDTVLSSTAGTAQVIRGSHSFGGARDVNISRLYKISDRCEWYFAPEFAVQGLRKALNPESVRAPDDAAWSAGADVCGWVADEEEFVFEIKSGRAFDNEFKRAASLTLTGPCLRIVLNPTIDSLVWAQQTQAQFDAFIAGAPLYFTLSRILVVGVVDSKEQEGASF